jgi:hypothetical protein
MPGPQQQQQQQSKDGRGIEPPVPESQVWLPSLAAPRGGAPLHGTASAHSTLGHLLPKTRHLPAARAIHGSDPSALYTLASFPTVESLGLTGIKQNKTMGGKVRQDWSSSEREQCLWYSAWSVLCKQVCRTISQYPQSGVPKLPSLEKSMTPKTGRAGLTGSIPALGGSRSVAAMSKQASRTAASPGNKQDTSQPADTEPSGV